MSLATITAWSLQSPNGTAWVPTISPAGLVTWTSGGAAITPRAPCFQGIPDTTLWTPQISDAGIVSLIDVPTMGNYRAALLDSNALLWLFLVDRAGIVNVGPASDSPVMYRWGTKRRWGMGWRWGHGVTEPWVQKGDPLTVTRFDVEPYEDQVVAYTVPGSRIYSIANTGIVSRSFDGGGSIPSESFYLQSPDGSWWIVTANGTTGTQSIASTGGTGQPIGLTLPSPDGRQWHYLIEDNQDLFVMTAVQWFSSGGDELISLDNTGLLTTRYNADGSVPSESFTLQSPNGSWWLVAVDGTTGEISTVSTPGAGAIVGKQLPSPDGRLWTLGVADDGTLTIGYAVQPYTVEPTA